MTACPRCGAEIGEPVGRGRGRGRPRTWCSDACRRSASLERRAAEAGAIAVRLVERDVGIEEHVAAVLASPAACRRVLRTVAERAAAKDLDHAKWVSVRKELERLRAPGDRPGRRW